MDAITSFDQVPAALNFLIGEVGYLRAKLAEQDASHPAADQWFNLEEFCKYHPGHPAPTTVYGWVSRREVPHKRDGKKLYFVKSEIDAWLMAKNRSTSADIERVATTHQSRKQRRGGRVMA